MNSANQREITRPDVSVVVPTYNRQSLLLKTLASLQAQHAGRTEFEVLVVDNNSSDDTPGAVEAFGRAWPKLEYIFESRRGVSHARNAGVAAARAPIVAFVDDDVEVGARWVATIRETFDAHPEVDCIGGRIDARWAAPPPRWFTPMFRAAVALQSAKGDSPYIDAEHASPCLMTANFACRRRVLDEVGGFAASYLRDEDRELQLRLWQAGKRGLYVDEMAVTTEVPCDRLTKAYHRAFYTRVGESHARMRYLDRIDARGRLLRDIPPRLTLLGTPGFIYRSLIGHAVRLAGTMATLQWNRAFFHETRLRYFIAYVWTRRRQEARTIRAAPREFVRLITHLFRRSVRT